MKIYDCFTFFNELDLLEIRLNTLNNVVDKFVLVEAKQTFSGKQKPLYFEENKMKYKQFLDKMIHVVVDFPKEINGAWQREYYQRDMIMEGLKNCKPDDLIAISDLDEIPKPEIVKNLKNSEDVNILGGYAFGFFLNYKAFKNDHEFLWYGPVISKYKYLLSPQKMRSFANFQNGISNINNPLSVAKNYLLFNIYKRIDLRTNVKIIKDAQWHLVG